MSISTLEHHLLLNLYILYLQRRSLQWNMEYGKQYKTTTDTDIEKGFKFYQNYASRCDIRTYRNFLLSRWSGNHNTIHVIVFFSPHRMAYMIKYNINMKKNSIFYQGTYVKCLSLKEKAWN